MGGQVSETGSQIWNRLRERFSRHTQDTPEENTPEEDTPEENTPEEDSTE